MDSERQGHGQGGCHGHRGTGSQAGRESVTGAGKDGVMGQGQGQGQQRTGSRAAKDRVMGCFSLSIPLLAALKGRWFCSVPGDLAVEEQSTEPRAWVLKPLLVSLKEDRQRCVSRSA